MFEIVKYKIDLIKLLVIESVLKCLKILKEVKEKFFEGNISIKKVIIFVSCDNLL